MPVLSATRGVTARQTHTLQRSSAKPARHSSIRFNPSRKTVCKPVAALEIDWSDPDTIVGAFACVSGIALGIGTLVWYGKVVERDEERLETLRELNRATFESTGEYLSEDEIEKIRVPKWTDRREFKDND